MQCPHQEEKNWTSQAEDELVTVGLRLPLLRISSGSSSVYRRAAARTHPGTSHRTSAAWSHEQAIIPAEGTRTGVGGEPSRSRRLVFFFLFFADHLLKVAGRHESGSPAHIQATCVYSREWSGGGQTSHSEPGSNV